MVHDIGPQRFHARPNWMNGWTRTKLGRELMPILTRHGLDRRDVYVGKGPRGMRVKTDRDWTEVRDGLASCADDLEGNLRAVAAGVAQERMMRLSGWRPGQEAPFWSVTASDMLVARIRLTHFTPAQVWNAGVNVDEDGWIDRRSFCTRPDEFPRNDPRSSLPAGCYVARYGTGMHLSWTEGDVDYEEDRDGAKVTVPASLLPSGAVTDMDGQKIEAVCQSYTALAEALGKYAITGARLIAAHPNACTPELDRVELRLQVPMRTLQPIPEDVLVKAGVEVGADLERDRPLWLLTDSDALRRYRVKVPQAA